MTSKTTLRLVAFCAILASAAPLAACDNTSSGASSGTSPDRTYPQDRATTAPGTTAQPATPSNSGR